MLVTIVITVLVTSLLLIFLQNFKTPEKVVERKIEHRHTISDPQFQREMSILLGPAIIDGNRAQALQNGDEIFPAMLTAIRSATTSVTFETFIYWAGDIGETFCRAFAERAQAGVVVNVMIDWVGSTKMDQSLLDTMESAGVQLHRYRPLRWYNIGRMNNRTHRKLLVVDGYIGFTGGVGIADQWTGRGNDPDHWRDTHYRIEGPVVAQLQAAFNDNWIKSTGKVLNGPQYFPEVSPWPDSSTELDLAERGAVRAHMFVASPSGGSESMHLMYLLALAAAGTRIDLAASYFVPDKLLLEALAAARKRGVKVRILLPGPYLDAPVVKVASKADWGTLLSVGVEIYIYQPTMLHTKLLIIDSLFVSVGSTNFDFRSIRLNDEASLNIYDHDFATEMTKIYEADLLKAKLYSLAEWKQRPLREKITEKIIIPIKSQL